MTSAPPITDDQTALGGWPKAPGISDEELRTLAQLRTRGDRSGEMADESIAAIRESSYLGLPVPVEMGGGGESLFGCCASQRALAAADPGLAIAMNMHLFSLGVMREHWLRKRDESWMLLEAVATQKRIVASAFAEPGLAGSLTRSRCRGVRQPKGWLVSGLKAPCSLAGIADLYCLQFEDDTGQHLSTALLPSDADGLEVRRSWHSLGMRASESHSVILTDCFVPQELVFSENKAGGAVDDVFAAGVIWFCMTATAVYLGVVRRALQEATRQLAAGTVYPSNISRSELRTVRERLGRCVSDWLTIDEATGGFAKRLSDSSMIDAAALPMAIGIKRSAVHRLSRIPLELMEIVGGAAYGADNELSALARDSLAGVHHPPTSATSDRIVGEWALGGEVNLDFMDDQSIDSDQ